jgi:hypothetical protein
MSETKPRIILLECTTLDLLLLSRLFKIRRLSVASLDTRRYHGGLFLIMMAIFFCLPRLLT